MAIMPAARDELEVLRILDEGKFAEKKYILPEVLRRYNVSQAEYNSLKKNFQIPDFPIAFASRDIAISYIAGDYRECSLRICENGRFRVEPVEIDISDPESMENPVPKKTEAGNTNRRLTAEEVECIAQELIEQQKTAKEISETWNTAHATVYYIKAGKHRHLTEKTKKELSSHFEVARKQRDAIPSIVPKKKKKKKIKMAKAAQATVRKKKIIEEPMPQVRTELVIPRQKRELEDIMKELRNAMRGQQIDSISIKSNGEVVILRKEVFRLDLNQA